MVTLQQLVVQGLCPYSLILVCTICYLFINFNLIYFLLVPLHRVILTPLTSCLIVVPSKTTRRVKRLGWVDNMTDDTFWTFLVFLLKFMIFQSILITFPMQFCLQENFRSSFLCKATYKMNCKFLILPLILLIVQSVSQQNSVDCLLYWLILCLIYHFSLCIVILGCFSPTYH